MATTTHNSAFLASTTVPLTQITQIAQKPIEQAHAITAKPRHRRRRLDRQSGQAIEILGHAIQYLADEFALDCLELKEPAFRNASGKSPRIEAIELLMSFNRQIYMSCPVVPTLPERLRSLFGR